MAVDCYWLERVGRWERTLQVHGLPCGHDDLELPWQTGVGDINDTDSAWDEAPWPRICPTCSVVIDYDVARRSMSGRTIYRRIDNGREGRLRDFGPGAMFDVERHDEHWTPDGRRISVILPGGRAWCIDAQSSNCTRPGEDHDCWCRHGEPPMLTVNKTPEPGRSTCDAGGGSIWVDKGEPTEWHGFLAAGRLVAVGET